jgi:hypothetical protein
MCAFMPASANWSRAMRRSARAGVGASERLEVQVGERDVERRDERRVAERGEAMPLTKSLANGLMRWSRDGRFLYFLGEMRSDRRNRSGHWTRRLVSSGRSLH